MKRNWLWDIKTSEEEVRIILGNPLHPKFDFYAELLFSRVDDPKIVFELIDAYYSLSLKEFLNFDKFIL